MFSWEKKFWQEVQKRTLVLAALVAFVLSAVIRVVLFDFQSIDMEWFLLPWYESIRQNGGLAGLNTQVGNYSMVYQTIIALFTMIPAKPLYLYKIFSCVFDYALAAVAAGIVASISGKKEKGLTVGTVLLFVPSVMLNSAMWGQCDSIFTFFGLLSLLLLLRGKYAGAFLAIGAALSFKLQAVFFLPFLLVWYVREKRVSFLYFLLIPVSLLLLNLPGIIARGSVLDIVRIYTGQMELTGRVSYNYPSFWNLAAGNNNTALYASLSAPAILLTVAVLLTEAALLLRTSGPLSGKDQCRIAFLLLYTCVYFLPGMHERYSYPYLALGLVLAFLEPHTLPAYLGLVFIDLRTYGTFLTETEVNWSFLTVLNLTCFAYYAVYILRGLVKSDPVRKLPDPPFDGV